MLTSNRLPNGKLRLSYPDWGARYAIRRRNKQKRDIVQVYAGGHEGLVANNGLLTVDVSLDLAEGYFELFLPAAKGNRRGRVTRLCWPLGVRSGMPALFLHLPMNVDVQHHHGP